MTDIEKLISEMTLDEKIAMLAGADLWHTVPNERLGIPAIKVSDGPNGARGAWNNLSPSSACLPVGMALGATWNVALLEQLGGLLAEEVQAKGAHILLAPTVNIHRTPIAGRNFECFAEDPYLSGQMATAYINGIQDRGVGACIKHFVCNDQEFERMSISAQVQERPLRELYLEPFRLAVRAAKPWAVMSAYNKVNGTWASENDTILKEILKQEWAFEGLVMSDWFGTYTPAVPAGGLDLEMPGPARWMSAGHVQAALDSGTLTLDALDDKVRRILRIVQTAGAFENPTLPAERSVDQPHQRQLLREAAQETIVLLTNQNELLPLQPQKLTRIAVIGELARWPNIMGGGSSQVTPHYVVSPLEGIVNRLGGEVEVRYAPGCFIHKMPPGLDPETLTTRDGQPGLELALYDNLDFSGEAAYTAVTPRTNFGWFDNSVPNVNQERFCMRLTGAFTPKESGQHTLGLSSVGQSRLFIDGDLVLDNWGEMQSNSEKTISPHLNAGQAYAIQLEFRWEGDPRWRTVRLGHMPPHAADLMAEAVALAQESDVVIVVAGLTSEWESEGYDRVDMSLPGDQDALIAQVAAVNPQTIVVLNTGSAVAMPWVDQVTAVIAQWYNSQECGNALADILFGDVSPSGKLPTTFPKRLEDNPAYLNYPGENGQVLYGEGLFVGYRYYDKKDVMPLFPFGHGLSYTRFEYSDLQLSASQFATSEGLKVQCQVRNAGARPGKEVVQLYVRDVQSSLVRPEKELKAFAKVSLEAGETKTVTFTLDQEAFWFYNPAAGGWQVEPGEFEILLGASSRDIRLRAAVEVVQSDERLHIGLTVGELLANDHGRSVLQKHFGDMIDAVNSFGLLDHTLQQLALLAPDMLSAAKLAEIAEDLAAE